MLDALADEAKGTKVIEEDLPVPKVLINLDLQPSLTGYLYRKCVGMVEM